MIEGVTVGQIKMQEGGWQRVGRKENGGHVLHIQGEKQWLTTGSQLSKRAHFLKCFGELYFGHQGKHSNLKEDLMICKETRHPISMEWSYFHFGRVVACTELIETSWAQAYVREKRKSHD